MEQSSRDITDPFAKLLKKLQIQFLCCYRIQFEEFKPLFSDITWEQQRELINATVASEFNKNYPIKISYQLNFLKNLISHLEQHALNQEVHDDIYETYFRVLNLVPQDCLEKYAFKHYLLPKFETSLTLRESKSFVAEGTTGLCSWEASLGLSDYLLSNKNIIDNASILELGAGAGLCGMILAKCCQPKVVYMTDGSKECVELMQENIERNFPNGIDDHLKTLRLTWQTIDSNESIQQFKINILLAADVVFDDTIFGALTHAIDFIFNANLNNIILILAATVRNAYTLNKFLALLDELQFHVEERHSIPLEQSNFYWNSTTPVKIYEITRQPN